MNHYYPPPLHLQTSSSIPAGRLLPATASYCSIKEAAGRSFQLVGHWPLQHAAIPSHLAAIRLIIAVVAVVVLAEGVGCSLARRKFHRRTTVAPS